MSHGRACRRRYDLFIVHAEADQAWVDGYLWHALGIEPGQLITPRGFQLGASISSPRAARQRELILQTIEELPAGDRLVVSELSRLGRSLGQIIQAVDQLLKKGVSLIAIKESIRLEGQQDLQTKVTIALFGLFAEIEAT